MTPLPPCDVVLLTEDRYVAPPAPGDWYAGNIHAEDGLLLDALRRLGLRGERRSWADPEVDWGQAKAAVLRTTWDYFHRFAEFSAWLERVSGAGSAAPAPRLINDPELLRWNLDKRYLGELAGRGVAAVPTRYVERGDAISLGDVREETGWRDVVFKPVVSGAARLTYLATGDSLAVHEPVFAACVAGEAMMVQPFARAVLDEGELSFVVIGGRATHAVRKRAKPGDFRVQDDYGGTVHPHALRPEEVAFAEDAVAACPAPPAYARVDAVPLGQGRLLLMELELVEPELFLRFHPPAADALAAEVARRLER